MSFKKKLKTNHQIQEFKKVLKAGKFRISNRFDNLINANWIIKL